ncbi:kynureninase [Pseudobacteriovorax antillogorgiicola]|nr:kynureninase [Pseudobacteriovorax antillogorgiicola]
MQDFQNSLETARRMDQDDPLHKWRDEFYIPTHQGEPVLYFCGNSLGLQPKTARPMIEQELKDWAQHGVEGHFEAERPWVHYHEFLTDAMAKVVGGNACEVVCMNSLTVNLHLMMVSFYRPEGRRRKILIEGGAFPSDQYAVASQARFHGLDADQVVEELQPRPGEHLLRTEDILTKVEELGDELALIMIGGVNYLTGQLYDMEAITQKGHAVGAKVGFDLAHGAGNVPLRLHDWGVDFAVWCSYKYLNSGPGGIAGCFVHENHVKGNLPRFEGWWGHSKEKRFKMEPSFEAIPSVEAWQLSNPPIFQLASLLASLKIFDQAGMSELRTKSECLTSYLEYMVVDAFGSRDLVITPSQVHERGAQLSFRIPKGGRDVLERLKQRGVICDFREPNIIRAAPTPLYNSYEDVFRFVSILKECVHELS